MAILGEGDFGLPPWMRQRAEQGGYAGPRNRPSASLGAASAPAPLPGSGAYGGGQNLQGQPGSIGDLSGGASASLPGGTYASSYNASPYATPSIPGLSGDVVGKYRGEGQGIDQMIQKELRGVLEGGQTSYSPERVAYMKAQAKSGTEGAARGGRSSLNADLIRRGMADSGEAARSMAELERGKEATYAGAVSKIAADKSMQDFQDRMQALDRAQNNIGQARQYVLGLVGEEGRRQGLLAQLSTATMQINAQREMLQGQLDNNMKQFGQEMEYRKQTNMIPVTDANGQTHLVPITALGLMNPAAPSM